jgi:ribosomal protein S18 acetylase RimI-like enzyme
MTGKVIQGSFLGGQARLAPSVYPKAAKTAPPPPIAFAARSPGALSPILAARRPGPPQTAVAPRPSERPMPAHAAQPSAVQRHGAGAFAIEAGPLGLVSTGGRPLPDAVRGKMEAALGADFSAVRVHVGPQAERIGAIAFTVGSDLYFAPGRYQPDTLQGQQLLGHELTHVVQQRAGRVRNPLGSGLAVVQDRVLEAEADRLGQRAAMHRVAVQAKLPSAAAQPSAPVRVSPPVGAGPGSYRLSAGAGGREIGSVMVHARDQGAVEVTDLGVDAAQRGNGVGQMLVAAAARTGLRSGRSKVTLAAQDGGSGHLTRWYKEMGFTQIGVNRHGYPQLEAPINRVLATAAQRSVAQRATGTLQATAINRAISPPPTRFGSAVTGRAASILQRMEAASDADAHPQGLASVASDYVTVHIWMYEGFWGETVAGKVLGIGHAAIQLTARDGKSHYITWSADGDPLAGWTTDKMPELGSTFDLEKDKKGMAFFFKHAEPSYTIKLPASPPFKYGICIDCIMKFWAEQQKETEYSFMSANSNCTGVIWNALKAGGMSQFHNYGSSYLVQGAAGLLAAVKAAKKKLDKLNSIQ